jgi:hypothetical protein
LLKGIVFGGGKLLVFMTDIWVKQFNSLFICTTGFGKIVFGGLSLNTLFQEVKPRQYTVVSNSSGLQSLPFTLYLLFRRKQYMLFQGVRVIKKGF